MIHKSCLKCNCEYIIKGKGYACDNCEILFIPAECNLSAEGYAKELIDEGDAIRKKMSKKLSEVESRQIGEKNVLPKEIAMLEAFRVYNDLRLDNEIIRWSDLNDSQKHLYKLFNAVQKLKEFE